MSIENTIKIVQTHILLHPKIGIGPKYINYDRKIQYSTLAKEAIKIQTKKEVLEEEMRLLYVALTRSREKLIITGLNKNVDKFIRLKQELLKANETERKIDTSNLKKAKSFLDWIEIVNLHDERIKKLITTNIYKAKDIINDEKSEKSEINIQIEKREINKKLDEIFTWEYKNKELTKIEGKSSVSKLAKQDEEVEYKCELKKPKFMEDSIKLSKAEIGTAVHLVMQKLDFNIEYTMKGIEDLLDVLTEKRILTENQKSEIPKEKILVFAKSELFQEIRNAKEVYREQPFYINVPLKEIYGKDIDEEILVQGIIDLYFINEAGEIILVDYKTDYVPNNDDNYLIEKYKKQLELYKRAIQQALNKKIAHTYIYSIFLGRKIEV